MALAAAGAAVSATSASSVTSDCTFSVASDAGGCLEFDLSVSA